MNRLCTLGKPLLAAFLLSTALDASSLTLGRARGAVLLGQPLNLSFTVQPGQDEDVSAICLDARVFYGDAQQASNQVSVSAEPGPDQSIAARLYVNSSVSEPVVVVELLAGCGQKTSRKYVFFADLAGDAGSLAGPVPAGRVLPMAPVGGENVAPKSSSWSLQAPTTAATPARDAGVATLPIPKQLRTKSIPPKAKTVTTNADSKLKLAPPMAAPERPPELKSSAQLTVSPIENLQKRLDAIAQWKALTLTPEQVQENDARVQSLEADLKALQAVTLKNQNNVQLLTTSLAQAESQRYSNPLVYALAALLLGMLAIAGYLLSKSRTPNPSVTPWWGNGYAQGGSGAPAEATLPQRATPPRPVHPSNQTAPVTKRDDPLAAPPNARVTAAVPGALDVDIALGDSVFGGLSAGAPPVPAKKAAPEVKRTDKRDFSPSGSATLRAINTKEMLDVRQQAEFFMALGQHDEAIKVLESSINESAEANPLVYLDLLKLFHTLSRRAEFDRYRDDFNLQFTGLVPGYARFQMEGNGLDNYADICNQIVALWPSDDALDYIEMCLVRQPQDEPGQGFDLEAFRDLLTLHGVLRRLDSTVDSAMVPFSASRLGNSSQLGGLLGTTPTAYDEQLDIATAPLPPIPHTEEMAAGTVDLDLTAPPSNLIDFDVEGLVSAPKPKTPGA